MYFGIDYYPEQWPEGCWAEDARLMKEAGFNVVRLAEFGWSLLEPQDGHYDFAWLDRAIATLAEQRIQIVLGTPTAAPPPWLTAAHPEVLPVDEHRQVKGAGSRRHYCPNGSIYKEYTRRIVTRMAERYGGDSRVIGWQIDNEFGCHDTARCYCDRCATAFRSWLRKRYGSLEALNTSWGTSFWGQTYTAWEQVPLPWATPAEHNPGLLLDFRRFSSESWVTYQKIQMDILRRLAPSQFITHNLMGFFDLLDYYELTAELDFVAWDNYHYDGATPALVAAAHDLIWGLRRKNFWVIEQQAGQVNWTLYNPLLRPGELRLKTYQGVAHGADGVLYFRWRAACSGSEQYHSGLLDQARRLTRGYKEALQIGEELKTIGERLEGTVPQPQVAILQDYDNRWVLQLQPHNQQLVGPDGWQIFFLAPYEALYRRNVSTVFIHPEADLSPYKLVVAPFLNLVTEEAFANLSAYVERGGILMLGPRAGFKDEYNRVFAAPPPGPLRQLAGVTVEEFDSLPPQSTNTIRFIAEELAGREVLVRIWCEVVVPSTARVVAHYIQDYYSGRAAVTVNQFGAGRVVYLGVVGGEELYDTLLDWLLPQAGVTPLLDTPPGVEVTVREGLDRQLLFILNHTQEAQEVTLEHPYRNLIGEVIVEGSVWIPARDVLVLESPTDLGGISVFQVQE